MRYLPRTIPPSMPVSKNIPQIDRCTHFVVKLEVWDAISMKFNCTISEGHLQYSYITSTAHATIKVSQQKTRISIWVRQSQVAFRTALEITTLSWRVITVSLTRMWGSRSSHICAQYIPPSIFRTSSDPPCLSAFVRQVKGRDMCKDRRFCKYD